MAVKAQTIAADRASGAPAIAGSLKMADGDGTGTPYLTRTNSSTGNRRTWTFSGWVKRVRTDNSQAETLISYSNTTTSSSGIEFGGTGSTGYENLLRFNSFNSGNDMDLWSAGRYRDLSSWYHILEIYDSTEATDTDRVKMYVNGEYITDWTAASYPTNRWPSQNAEGPFCYAGSPGGYIGTYWWSASISGWKGNFYYSDFYLLDGNIAGPENFGYTDPLTNVWRPKKKYEAKAPNKIGKFFSANFAASDGFQAAHPALNAFNGGYGTVDVGRAACSSSGCTLTLSSIGVTVNRKLEIWSGYGSASVNGGTAVDYDSSAPGWQDLSFTGALSSIVITGASGVSAGELYAVRVDGVILVDNGGYGTTGFYLPFDGNSAAGKDQSGSGNDWDTMFFGGSTVPSKATGAKPILQIVNGGKVASAGVTSEAGISTTLMCALPFCMYPYDESYKVRGGSKKPVTIAGNTHLSRDTSVFYGSSYEFDGTGDYIVIPNSGATTDFGLVEQDWTVEVWAYITGKNGTNGRLWYLEGDSSSNIDGVYFSDTNMSMGTTGVWSVGDGTGGLYAQNRWQHIAVCHDSTNIRMYINGVESLTSSSNFYNSASKVCTLMSTNNGSFAGLGIGYLQDFRIYNGHCKYTENFTPASSIPDIVSDSPSNIVYGSNPKTPINGSVEFSDGNYLTTADSADWYLGDTFTVEAWVYALSGSDRTIVAQGASGWKMYVQSNGRPTFYDTTGGEEVSGDSGHVEDDKWSHVAFSCNSGTGVFYINGEESGSSGSMDVADYSDALEIGREGSDNNYWPGWISNLRIVKGTALYTTNFNPIDLDQPLTDVTNTKLLCCQDPKNKGAYVTSPAAITSGGTPFASGFNPYDEDLPTVLGKGGTFATMNDAANSGDVDLSDGNLTINEDAAGEYHNVTSTLGMTSGKFYCEYRHTLSAVGNGLIGISPGPFMQGAYAGSSSGSDSTTENAYGFYTYNRGVLHENSYNMNGVASNVHSRVPQGSTIGIALDMDNYKCWWSVDGIWQTYPSSSVDNPDPVTGAEPHASGFDSDSDTWYFCWTKAGAETGHFNFGQQPFTFNPPEGYTPLCAANLQSPGNARPDQYVKPVIWTGDGVDGRGIPTGFAPDLVWLKRRNGTTAWILQDTVRGATKDLYTNTQGMQYTDTSTINGFYSEGFNVGDAASTNSNTNTYVAYCYKAGGNKGTWNVDDKAYASAAAAGLDGGSIDPSGASVGTEQGFGIYKYTGNGTSGADIAHGLTQAPDLIIAKNLDEDNTQWLTSHRSAGLTGGNITGTSVPEWYELYLNSNAARADNGTDVVAPDGTTKITLGSGDNINKNTINYIMYAWHNIPGVQKFGSYSSNNSATDGNFIELGFRPAVVVIKNITGYTEHWLLWDDKINTANPTDNYLYPNLDLAVADDYYPIDFLSNGFKLWNNAAATNGSAGSLYVYMAWAYQPFHNLYGAQSNAR